MDIVVPIVTFLVICSLAAFWAAAMKRRWWVWFLIALFLTPLVAFIGLIIVFFTSGQPRRITRAVKQGVQSSYDAITEHSSSKTPMNEQDRELYVKAGSEIASKTYDQALFTKAFSEANGDENKAQALYIRYRVNELRARRHKIEQEQEEETRRREKQEQEEALIKSLENIIIYKDGFRAKPWTLTLTLDEAIFSDTLSNAKICIRRNDPIYRFDFSNECLNACDLVIHHHSFSSPCFFELPRNLLPMLKLWLAESMTRTDVLKGIPVSKNVDSRGG
jgi:hypothetical protein